MFSSIFLSALPNESESEEGCKLNECASRILLSAKRNWHGGRENGTMKSSSNLLRKNNACLFDGRIA